MTSSSHKVNILVAWPYIASQTVEFLNEVKHETRFLCDSGAFTAWKAGKVLKVDDYCRFIESLGDLPWRYFALDVIGDPDGTMKNLEIMNARGFNPIPVFTRGENLSVLEDYYKVSDVVALGGLVGTKKNKGFVKGIMSKVGDRKTHWLGFGYQDFIPYYKPYSFDSSSWSAAFRYGMLKLYITNGKWIALGKKDFLSRPNIQVQSVLSGYGIDINRLQNQSEWRCSGRGVNVIEEVAYKSWTKYQLEVEKKFGSKFFMACSTLYQTDQTHLGVRFWRDSTVENRFTFWEDGLKVIGSFNVKRNKKRKEN